MNYHKHLLGLFLFVCALFIAPIHSYAEEGVFTVKDLEIVYKQGDPNLWREKAIKMATKKAFSKLLRQLTPYDTWMFHERVIPAVNWDAVSYKTSIVSESHTPYYKATLDVHYRANAVKKLLTEFNIPYSENTGGKVLVVPVFEERGSKLLWETVNPLRKIISENMRKSSYFEYVMPTGDMEEVRSLSAEMASLGAGDLILSLAKNYEASFAVVYDAKINERYGTYYLDVTASWYENDMQVEPVLYTVELNHTHFNGTGIDYEAIEPVLTAAVNNVLPRLGEHKRHTGLVEVNKPGRVFLRFKPADARDLEKLKTLVSNLNTIKEFKLRVLNVKDSVFQVDFYGEKQAFKEQLKKIKLTVDDTNMAMVWKVQFKNDPFVGPVDYGFDNE